MLEIDVGRLSELHAFRDDETGHVAIRPETEEELREWAESRVSEEDPHPLTAEVQGAIIDQVDIWL